MHRKVSMKVDIGVAYFSLQAAGHRLKEPATVRIILDLKVIQINQWMMKKMMPWSCLK